MTTTDRKVSRVTVGEHRSRYVGHKARRIVVTILPGDTLCLRLHGTQQREFIAIGNVFDTARCRRVLAEGAAKRASKRRKAQ